MTHATLRRLTAAALLTLLLTAGAAQAQTADAAPVLDWNRTDDPLFEGIGIHMGMSGGAGLAYKIPVQWWMYVQVAGGIWNNNNENRHNLGVELQYVLRAAGRDKLFLGASMAHYYHRTGGMVRDHVSSGFGVGIERLHTERISFQVELDFLYQGDEDSIILFPQGGVFFYF